MSLKRISCELRALRKDLPQFVEEIIIDPDDIKSLVFIIKGPKYTPYEGGKFAISIVLPDNYPFSSPHAELKTRICHPNFSFDGKLCKNCSSFKTNWSPVLNIKYVLNNIYECIEQIDTPCSFNIHDYNFYHQDKELYLRIARDYTLNS